MLGIVIAFAQAFCWANTTIALRSLSNRLDPFLVNGLRAAVALLVIIPLVFITGGVGDYRLLTLPRMLLLVGSVTLGGVIGDALYVTSLKKIGVSRAFPITNSYPVFTMLLGALVLGEKITWIRVVGMAIVLLGVYFVSRPEEGTEARENGVLLSRRVLIEGAIMALITAFLWGSNTVILAIGIRGLNSAVANSVRVPAVVLFSLLAGAQRKQLGSLRHLDRHTLGLLLVAGIVGWGIGGWFYLTAVQMVGVSLAAIISATSPIFGVPLSMLFLHEKPTRLTLIGTVLSIVGIALILL
jgi:drug/metabolite transporter (DMT)-like permease